MKSNGLYFSICSTLCRIFFCANYKNGCFLFIFLAITGIIIIVHLDKDSQGNHNTSVDEVCMMSMVCVIFILTWPVILTLAFIAGVCYFYYLIVGLIIKLVTKRIS